ncbi:unnamed protein product [Brassica napus]|uniref:(rape) hypothetical protein n=1 Tax=Brassica napus TaxID=3708 RepID=A0A816XDN7_BRANA|nr:unnamed protein product [Brassica napus]
MMTQSPTSFLLLDYIPDSQFYKVEAIVSFMRERVEIVMGKLS